MKRLYLLSLVLLLTAATNALAQDVRYNFDKSANFGTFKTYKWVVIKGATPVGDLADRQIKASVDMELSKKGLMKSDSDVRRWPRCFGSFAMTHNQQRITSFNVLTN